MSNRNLAFSLPRDKTRKDGSPFAITCTCVCFARRRRKIKLNERACNFLHFVISTNYWKSRTEYKLAIWACVRRAHRSSNYKSHRLVSTRANRFIYTYSRREKMSISFESREMQRYRCFIATTHFRAPGGELQMILDRDEVPEERQVARLLKQILDGIAFLHSLNVAHLDIKVRLFKLFI